MQPSMGIFERYLSLWVGICMLTGIALGAYWPNFANSLDNMSILVNNAPVISIPIAICLFFMMFPIMVKIDFAAIINAGKSVKPILLTLIVNWGIKPMSMYLIAYFFLGILFKQFIGTNAVDLIKIPFGLDLAIGEHYGSGIVVIQDGIKMLSIPLWRSYLAGCILLGVAPCTAMVLVWGELVKGNSGHTLIMVAINSLMMLLLYGIIGGFLLGIGELPIPWQALLISISIYVALPLIVGYISRKILISYKGLNWFEQKFLPCLSPITIVALLFTLILLFAFKGKVIVNNPLTIVWIAIPLTIQTILIFTLTYLAAKFWGFSYENAAPSALIGASNHFEVAIATAVMLFGLGSGAALATVVGVLIEVPLMLALVKFCNNTSNWFKPKSNHP